jgi:cell division protein FtsI (penicillin-binding protein 3)
MDRRKELLWRAYVVMFFFVVATAVILLKVFNISVIEREKWLQKGKDNVQWRTVDADRGNIYDETENLLATSVQFFEVRVDLAVVKQDVFDSEVDSLALFLSQFDSKRIRSKSAREWKKELVSARKKQNRYFYIARGLDIDDLKKLRKAPILKHGKYKGGLIENRYGRRIHPYGIMASRTIGVDRENADKIGLEGYFDKFLSGPKDQRLMKRLSNKEDEKDVWVSVFDPSENEIVRGDDIYTTLNVEMQDIVHHELLKSLTKHKAVAGTAVLMDVKTGAIKAMSNLSRMQDSSYQEVYNHAVGRLSEPGSTMKLATVMAVMEDGMNNTDTLLDVNFGVKKFADRTMYDSEKHGKKYMSMAQAFELSSNVGVALMANDLYNSRDSRPQWVKRLVQFGLDEPTGIDIPGEAIPYIKDPVKDAEKWYGTTVAWMGHGYELMTTPLQMLNLYNSVANNGKMMKPFLVRQIKNGDHVKKIFSPVVLKDNIASDSTIQKARKLLEGVVLNGTGKNIFSPHVSLAGKTGTARVNYANKSEYARYNASFCGYFPADNPKYSMIVVIYEPSVGGYYGGSVAAPVFKNVAEKVHAIKSQEFKILENEPMALNSLPGSSVGFTQDYYKLFNYLDIDYKRSHSLFAELNPSQTTVLMKEYKNRLPFIPDVRGMGARDAVYLLESAGVKVKLSGAGKVKRQSVPPGSKARGQTVMIYLN